MSCSSALQEACRVENHCIVMFYMVYMGVYGVLHGTCMCSRSIGDAVIDSVLIVLVLCLSINNENSNRNNKEIFFFSFLSHVSSFFIVGQTDKKNISFDELNNV